MKRLPSIETDKVQLEIVECDCGYHMGIDATFLDQVGDIEIECPSCQLTIFTAEACPADLIKKAKVIEVTDTPAKPYPCLNLWKYSFDKA